MVEPADCAPHEASSFDGLRSAMLANLTAHADSFFTYNCATHCGQLGVGHRWRELLDAEGVSLRDRLTRWAFGGEKQASIAPQGWGSQAHATCAPSSGGNEKQGTPIESPVPARPLHIFRRRRPLRLRSGRDTKQKQNSEL